MYSCKDIGDSTSIDYLLKLPEFSRIAGYEGIINEFKSCILGKNEFILLNFDLYAEGKEFWWCFGILLLLCDNIEKLIMIGCGLTVQAMEIITDCFFNLRNLKYLDFGSKYLS